MNPQDQESSSRPNPLVRWFVAGLPAGLLVMGAFSFVIYFQKRNAREAAAVAPSRYAAMLRKDVNLEDYRRYVRIFEQDIGPRTPEKPDAVEAAQSFLESTLGYGNMGYNLVRREESRRGKPCIQFEAELPGAGSSPSVLLITARYDGGSGRDIAALICLANAFTGTTHRDRIRFIAWSGGGDGDAKFSLEDYRRWLPDDAEGKVSILEMRGPDPADADALKALRDITNEIESRSGGK